MLISCLVFSSALQMKAIYSSGTSVDFTGLQGVRFHKIQLFSVTALRLSSAINRDKFYLPVCTFTVTRLLQKTVEFKKDSKLKITNAINMIHIHPLCHSVTRIWLAWNVWPPTNKNVIKLVIFYEGFGIKIGNQFYAWWEFNHTALKKWIKLNDINFVADVNLIWSYAPYEIRVNFAWYIP
jgi:hypothetical protein